MSNFSYLVLHFSGPGPDIGPLVGSEDRASIEHPLSPPSVTVCALDVPGVTNLSEALVFAKNAGHPGVKINGEGPTHFFGTVISASDVTALAQNPKGKRLILVDGIEPNGYAVQTFDGYVVGPVRPNDVVHSIDNKQTVIRAKEAAPT